MIIKSIIVNPIYPNMTVNHLASVLQETVDSTFFDAVEVWDSDDALFLKLIEKYSLKIEIDVSLSVLMKRRNLSLIASSVDERKRAWSYLRQRIIALGEHGISHISISSPDDVPDHQRTDAFCILVECMQLACIIAKENGVSISFEAFDRDIHKRRLLGPTNEVIDFAARICRTSDNFFLTWDSAHVYLQEKELLMPLVLSLPYVKRIHLANASLDRADPFFGDCHIPFEGLGEVGIDDVLSMNQVIIGRDGNKTVSVAFEIGTCGYRAEWLSEEYILKHIMDLFTIINLA